jgi:hypothetical protein
MQKNLYFNLLIFASIAMGAACTMRFFVFLYSKDPNKREITKKTYVPYSLLGATIILIILGFFPFVK